MGVGVQKRVDVNEGLLHVEECTKLSVQGFISSWMAQDSRKHHLKMWGQVLITFFPVHGGSMEWDGSSGLRWLSQLCVLIYAVSWFFDVGFYWFALWMCKGNLCRIYGSIHKNLSSVRIGSLGYSRSRRNVLVWWKVLLKPKAIRIRLMASEVSWIYVVVEWWRWSVSSGGGGLSVTCDVV